MSKEEYERAVADSIQSQLSPVTRGALVGPTFTLPTDAEVTRVHPTGCTCAGCTTPRGGFEFL